jgi:single-stranded DNA-binding protein
MNINIVVLAGQLAVEPELRVFDSGSSLLRLLVTTRSTEPRRRVDVIPVVLWDPDAATVASLSDSIGKGVWVAGSVQRRFWTAPDGKASRVEVVAHVVELRDTMTTGLQNEMTG